MIVLDTNVLSEATRPAPSEIVGNWLRSQRRNDIFTTTITEAEMLGGLTFMPSGKRRDHLSALIDSVFMQEFAGRVLAFDRDAARAFPGVLRAMKRKPEPIMGADVQIAAIALAHGATIATRNIKHFVNCGVPVINPWTA